MPPLVRYVPVKERPLATEHVPRISLTIRADELTVAAAGNARALPVGLFRVCQLPDVVSAADGRKLKKPDGW